MHAEDVGLLRELFDAGGVAHAELRGLGRREVAIPRDALESEALGALRDLAADGAHAEDAEGLAVQAFGFDELTALPAAVAQRRDGVGDAAVQREHHAHDELGDGGAVLAGAMGDVDAALRGGLHVDGVVLGAGADDQVEVLGLGDGLPRDLGRADDQDAELVERVLEGFLRELRLVDDLDGEGPDFFDGAGVQLVGDQETHGARTT